LNGDTDINFDWEEGTVGVPASITISPGFDPITHKIYLDITVISEPVPQSANS